MLSTTQRSLNSHPGGLGNQINHCNENGGNAAFPEAITIRMPDGARFTIEKIGASSTLKDIATSLYDGGGVASRAFPPIEFGRSFNFSFGGRSYPANARLSSVHEEINLNTCGDVEYKTTDAKVAADKLKSGTGKEWRVLNENKVQVDLGPFEKKEQAAASANDVLKKIPHSASLIEVKIGIMQDDFYQGKYFHVTMCLANRHSIRMIAEGIPTEIGLAAPLIAQAVRTGNPAGLGMLPLDVLASLGMFLAPERSGINHYDIMQAEIEHAGKEYIEAPVFRTIAPVAANGIRESIAATASLLLRGEEKNARVSNVDLSNAGLTLYFSDALYAGKFIRTMKHAGYHSASLQWVQPDERHGGCAATISITDFNEIKRFVEATCGLPDRSTQELFETVGQKLQLPSQFFIQELEEIGKSSLMTLEQKKAAAKRLMQDYLPCLNLAEAGNLRDAVWENSRPDQEGNTGSLQYLREKRGIGRMLSISDYSDNVATFREMMAAIDGLIPKA